MFILTKVVYRFNVISIKIQMAFFTEIGKKILYGNHKRLQIAKVILIKKNKAGGSTYHNFKLN